jgi:RNA polymerase-binding transcription factor DksA
VAKPAAKAVPRPAVKPAKPAIVSSKPGRPGVAAANPKQAKTAGAAKPVPAGKGGKPVVRVVQRPAAEVRPIGALPPEAVARAIHSRSVAAPVRREPPITRPARPTHIPDSGVEGVTDQDYQEFEQRLISERQRVMKEMGYLENTVLKVNQRDSAGDLSGYSFHMADVGTDAMEREKAFLLASSEGRLLMEINEALRKLYAGEFGRCEICEKPIARARLEAMPYARLCLSCKEKEEKERRGAS